ncbi:YhcN/YlaJ family sporulation lipoprotein [Brevibacillus borstelensis]|uniref:YhcN/YlaJ family sporulation lipoprotein n=1 Tax=Brevibacillus borstelensis TaxID=45462 RepID=UPI0030C1BF78
MNKWAYSLVGVMVLAAVSGCANAGTDQNKGTQTNNLAYQRPAALQNNAQPNNGTANNYGANNYQNGFQAQGFNRDVAERLARSADNVPGVEGATAAVYGNDCIIGVRTRFGAQDMQQRQVIERQVHSAARAAAPNLNIRVTSDDNMFSRVQNIRNTVTNGLTNTTNTLTSGPNTVAGNLANAANDFTVLLRDVGRTVTAPFR